MTTLRSRRETLLCAALTAAVAGCVHLVVAQPGDAAAHLYRTFLVRHGVLVWDNLWFAGQYPLASYSLLYYLPAALVGNLPLVFAASVASTLLFAAIARAEWGAASIWPARAFGVLAAAPLFTGLYAYSLGFTAMLGALRAFQQRRTLVGLGLAALTLGFSPLAFVFLCLLLGSSVVGRLREWRRAVVVGAGLLLIGGAQAAAMMLFPQSGVYPFHTIALVAVVGVSVLGILVVRGARNGGPLQAFFALWAVGGIVCFVVPTPLGDNWARLSAFLFPVMLVAATLARFRPRVLVAVALAGALAYNVTPYLLLIPYRLDVRPEKRSFWDPALSFLSTHLSTGFRVEVVPTASHWESYWVPRAGYALARGFYDQIDASVDPTVHRARVSAAAYRAWLHSLAVEYVLLASTELDRAGGQGEARLLRSGRSGLPVVARTANWTMYRVPHPTPMLTGPGRPTVTRVGHSVISGVVTRPGVYLLRARYSPAVVLAGRGCVERGRSSMTVLRLTAPGRFRLRAIESPGDAIDQALAEHRCSSARR